MVNGNFDLGPTGERIVAGAPGLRDDYQAVNGNNLLSSRKWLKEQRNIIDTLDSRVLETRRQQREEGSEEQAGARTIGEITNAIRDLLGQEAQSVINLLHLGGINKVKEETRAQLPGATTAVISRSEAADPMEWTDDATIKLLSEMTKAIMDQHSPRNAADTAETQTWVTGQLMEHFADPTRRLDDNKFVMGSPEYQGLNDSTQLINETVDVFERLTGRASDPRELFKNKRIELLRKKMLETELISEELNNALEKGISKRDGNDELVQMAYDTFQGLARNEYEITKKALNESGTSASLNTAYNGFFSNADVSAMLDGDFGTDNAKLIPVPGASIRTAIEEENQQNRLNTFANNKSLANAVSDVLGPVIVSTEDEDSIEKNTRNRLLNYLESLRSQIRNSQPGLSDQEVGAFLYGELISATMPDTEGPGGTSLIDRFNMQESTIVADEKARTEDEEAAKKANREREAEAKAAAKAEESAAKAERKRLQGASSADGLAQAKEYIQNQFTLDTSISAEGLNTMAAEWYRQQQYALASGENVLDNSAIFGQFNASLLGPGGFIDQGWTDQAIKNPALMYETYTDPNDPSRQLKVSDAANRSGYQMAPDGRVGQAGTRWDPIRNEEVGGATYIDPMTNQIAVDQFGNPILLKGKEILENAHLVDPLTLFNYQRTMDMSPGEIENMGMGGAPPAFPVQDFSAFLPDQEPLTKGDMYTIDAFGNKIPYYPYGDPSDPVPGGRAFPDYQGADYERYAKFLPQPAPPDRYEQELKFKDTVIPSQDQLWETGSGSWFDLNPRDQGFSSGDAIMFDPPAPEPVESVSKADFMALSEPEF